jgi:hypothetical protein
MIYLGIFCIAGGMFFLTGAILNWNWLMNSKNWNWTSSPFSRMSQSTRRISTLITAMIFLIIGIILVLGIVTW